MAHCLEKIAENMPIHKKNTWNPIKVMEDGGPDGVIHHRLVCLNDSRAIDGNTQTSQFDGPVKGISAHAWFAAGTGRNNGAVRFETIRINGTDGESVAVEDREGLSYRDYAADSFDRSRVPNFTARVFLAPFFQLHFLHRCSDAPLDVAGPDCRAANER